MDFIHPFFHRNMTNVRTYRRVVRVENLLRKVRSWEMPRSLASLKQNWSWNVSAFLFAFTYFTLNFKWTHRRCKRVEMRKWISAFGKWMHINGFGFSLFFSDWDWRLVQNVLKPCPNRVGALKWPHPISWRTRNGSTKRSTNENEFSISFFGRRMKIRKSKGNIVNYFC